jgi:hypothetical protein
MSGRRVWIDLVQDLAVRIGLKQQKPVPGRILGQILEMNSLYFVADAFGAPDQAHTLLGFIFVLKKRDKHDVQIGTMLAHKLFNTVHGLYDDPDHGIFCKRQAH